MPEPTDPWSTYPSDPAERVERIEAPYDAISSGAPPQRSLWRRGALAAGLAALALVAAGATGVALAGNGNGTAPVAVAATGGSTTPAPPRGGEPPMRGRGGLMGLAGAVRGEVVVPDGSGGWTTVVFQRGKATRVGADSITVTSQDGVSRTYDVPAGAVVGALRDGLGSVSTNDQVLVVADKDGGNPTARSVVDLSTVGRGLGGPHGPGDMGRWGDDPDGAGSADGSQGTSFGV